MLYEKQRINVQLHVKKPLGQINKVEQTDVQFNKGFPECSKILFNENDQVVNEKKELVTVFNNHYTNPFKNSCKRTRD